MAMSNGYISHCVMFVARTIINMSRIVSMCGHESDICYSILWQKDYSTKSWFPVLQVSTCKVSFFSASNTSSSLCYLPRKNFVWLVIVCAWG
jgi:hypothetical protein